MVERMMIVTCCYFVLPFIANATNLQIGTDIRSRSFSQGGLVRFKGGHTFDLGFVGFFILFILLKGKALGVSYFRSLKNI